MKNIILLLASSLVLLGIVSLLDKVLAVGLIFCSFLILITFLYFSHKKFEKNIYFLFVCIFILHLLFSLFVYYFHFQPFGDGGGDFTEYDYNARQISNRLNSGNFSLIGIQGLFAPISQWSHYFSVLVGYIYAFTIPSMLMGQIFNVWLAALVSIIAYFIALEVGAPKKGAFLVSIIVAIYPSLLFFSSLLLKDPLIIMASLLCLLLILKMVKRFDWKIFILFYVLSGLVIHLRFYVGFAVIFTFLISFAIFGKINFKKRLCYVAIFFVIFGFLIQFVTRDGYWGTRSIKEYLNPATITYYRETIYDQPITVSVTNDSTQSSNTGSNFEVRTEMNKPVAFMLNISESFTYSLLGPLPWQLKYKRHLFVLLETIPWYIMLFFITRGIIKRFKEKARNIFPILLFSFLVLGTLSLFISNFGIVTRIRIPALVSLICLLPLGVPENSSIYSATDRAYRKIFLTATSLKNKIVKYGGRI